MTDQDSHEPLPPAPEPEPEPGALPVPSNEPEQLFQGLPLGNFRPRRASRPLIGASLWCFGALFWSYLVVGEIVVWTALPEALGVLAVMDDVYDALVTVDFPDAITGGLRRTLDALRAVLERTRGDVTTTVLQTQLRDAIERSVPDG